jgi:diacylglycerol kinase (ATP)
MPANEIIANENANWGSGRLRVRQATDVLRKCGFPFSLSTAEYPGHARELAATAAAQRIDTIVVVGGDGTLNEVVNGLFASGHEPMPRIGIVPAGSSNDFSKSLGVPQRLEDACRTLMNGRTRDIDVGRAGPHYFCSASCLGYFAEVAARSLEMRGFGGSLRYVLPALTVIGKMKSGWEMSVTADGRTFHGVYAVLLVGNAPRFGGLTMLPGAKPDDGVLDCLLIEMAGKWEALRLIPLVYRKAMERHRRVTRFRAASLSVTLDRPTRLCNDGEVPSSPVQSIDYRVLPRRLQVIC